MLLVPDMSILRGDGALFSNEQGVAQELPVLLDQLVVLQVRAPDLGI
ncbi:hypothetical protein LJK88_05525 [Paenibacillus sp. P26]|nr:hypothetical protein LJK88_05525 [Paenibacillus sp. P26]UUZ90496.1 hypothetical protein LJK87_31980 [Paenibacillus sp. P25]